MQRSRSPIVISCTTAGAYRSKEPPPNMMEPMSLAISQPRAMTRLSREQQKTAKQVEAHAVTDLPSPPPHPCSAFTRVKRRMREKKRSPSSTFGQAREDTSDDEVDETVISAQHRQQAKLQTRSVPPNAWQHVMMTQSARESQHGVNANCTAFVKGSRSQSDLDADCEDNTQFTEQDYDTSSIVSASELLSVQHAHCKDGQACAGDRRNGCVAPLTLYIPRKKCASMKSRQEHQAEIERQYQKRMSGNELQQCQQFDHDACTFRSISPTLAMGQCRVISQARSHGGVLSYCSRLTHAHSLDAAVNVSNETHPRLIENTMATEMEQRGTMRQRSSSSGNHPAPSPPSISGDDEPAAPPPPAHQAPLGQLRTGDERFERLERTIDELSRRIETLTQENMQLRADNQHLRRQVFRTSPPSK